MYTEEKELIHMRRLHTKRPWRAIWRDWLITLCLLALGYGLSSLLLLLTEPGGGVVSMIFMLIDRKSVV